MALSMAQMEAKILELETIINSGRFTSPRMDVNAWQAAKDATPILPSGDRNVYDRMREIGISQDSIVERVSKIETSGATPAPAPAPAPSLTPAPAPAPSPTPAPVSGPTIAPLTAAQVSAFNGAMQRGVSNGMPIASQASQIASELAQGVYSLFNNTLIEAVKLWFYGGAAGGDRTALYPYLVIVDQRDPVTNAQLSPTDPRVKQVSSSASPTPSPTPVPYSPPPSGGVLPLVPASGTANPQMRQTNSILLNDSSIAAMEASGPQVFNGPVQFNGPVGMGGPPLNGRSFTVRKGGEVTFLEKVLSANTQNKTGDVWRAGCVSINGYDNGGRLIRGGFWQNGVLNRVQDIIDIFGFDSAGTVSKSHEDYSQGQVERCQDWIVREDADAKEIVVVACRAGWGVRVAASTQTTNNLNENNFDRAALLIAPLPGAV